MWYIKIVQNSDGQYFIMFDYDGMTKYSIDCLNDGTSIMKTAVGEKVAEISSNGFNSVNIKKIPKKKH